MASNQHPERIQIRQAKISMAFSWPRTASESATTLHCPGPAPLACSQPPTEEVSSKRIGELSMFQQRPEHRANPAEYALCGLCWGSCIGALG